MSLQEALPEDDFKRLGQPSSAAVQQSCRRLWKHGERASWGQRLGGWGRAGRYLGLSQLLLLWQVNYCFLVLSVLIGKQSCMATLDCKNFLDSADGAGLHTKQVDTWASRNFFSYGR